nr:immunoglobulin light chain junction region [Macaca mulatta]MOV65486.1 immunoglobulin light chain junction region [Macaca mulatta]
CQQETNWSWTF